MKNLLLKYLSIVVTLYSLSSIISSIRFDDLSTLLIMGLVLFFANMIIRPLLLIITLPFNLLSLGLLTFIVNAWTLMIADLLVPACSMGGFLNSFLAAFIIHILYHLINFTNKTTERINDRR